MADSSAGDAAATVRSSHHSIAVGLHEAALDSPTFRATAAHYAEQIDAVEKWLNGYVSSTSKLLNEVLSLEETINTFLTKTMPSNDDAIIDNDYTFLALKRVGDGSRECLMQMLSSMKRMEGTVVEPVRLFLVGDLRNFKEIRKALEQTQRTYDSTLARYASQSKTKEPSALREDAFAVYETRKAYLQSSMDFCQLAPQVRFSMDQLLVKVSGEIWKEMKRARDATTNATRWESEMERLRGWAKEMDVAESVLRRELQIARRDLGDEAMTGCKPSRELEDYSTSTVQFLGSRGPSVNLQTKDGDAVISEKQGWLFLRTISGKPARHNWVRRWYYCRDGVFGWLIPGPHGVLQGDEIGVLLCNAKPAVGEERRFCFEVKTKSLTLMLQAEGQHELTEWLEVFEVTKKKAFEASMDRDSSALPGGVDPAFSISPPSISEFSARTLDAQLGLVEEIAPPVERAGTLPVPNLDPNLVGRQSFDVNGSLSRRSFTALGRDLAREEGESGREHAARIIQKLDLHRKATFGAGAEAAIASSSGSAGSIPGLIAASHSIATNSTLAPSASKQASNLLPSINKHPGTLAPLTLAKPPAVTTLSRTAVLTAGDRGPGSSGLKIPPSVLANYWGSNVWGALTVPVEPTIPRLDEDDPIGVVQGQSSNTLTKAEHEKRARETLPTNYPPELRAQHAQFRLLFPYASTEEKLVLVFRASWISTAANGVKGPGLMGDGRIYVTPNNLYFYSQQMGLVTAYSLSLDIITEVTAAPGRDSDSVFLHLGQDTNDTGYTRITIKVFLDDLRLLHTRLNLLVDNLQAEEPMELEEIVAALINVERDDGDKRSPSAESWEEISENTPIDDGTPTGRPVPGRPMHDSNPRLLLPRAGGFPQLQLPAHPVIYEPEDMKELASERHFEISAKACFHVLFGDKSFVFPKLYFERRAQQIAQGPWVAGDRGRLRREFQFKVDHTDLLGRSKTMDITDHQVIEVHSDHVTYVVTHVKTAWHLPHSSLLKLVTKIVITHVAKSKCRLAVYTRIDWSKSPALSKNLVERQALHDVASDAEELAELATDQVRKLGARSRTNRAIQVYGHVGQQTQVVVFSPAATDSGKKQAVKPRTLTALVWETVRSFGESAVSSIIMWAFAGLRKLFEIATAQRLILALLSFSALTNLYLSSSEVSVWWKERQAASFMRRVGVGPNNMMAKAIYMTDLADASGTIHVEEEPFPRNSTCFAGFEEVLGVTDMAAPWQDAGTSFSSALTRSTARRLRKTRQRLGSYRHDLVVAMRVVNSVEREVLQSEWENWLQNEMELCDDLGLILQEDSKDSKGSSSAGGDKSSKASKTSSQTIKQSLTPDRKVALENWRDNYCGSCRKDYDGMMEQRRHAEL